MQMRDTGHCFDSRVQRRVLIAAAWICACANLLGQPEAAPTQLQTGLVPKKATVKSALWLSVDDFECGWGQAINGAVQAYAIIERRDVVEEGGTGLELDGEGTPVNQFQFDSAPEACPGGIVAAVAAAAAGARRLRQAYRRLALKPSSRATTSADLPLLSQLATASRWKVSSY